MHSTRRAALRLSSLRFDRIHTPSYRLVLSATQYPSTQVSVFPAVHRRSMSQHSVPADPTAKPETGASAGAAPESQPTTEWNFTVSPTPPNPLGEGKYIKQAAALIIGYG